MVAFAAVAAGAKLTVGMPALPLSIYLIPVVGVWGEALRPPQPCGDEPVGRLVSPSRACLIMEVYHGRLGSGHGLAVTSRLCQSGHGPLVRASPSDGTGDLAAAGRCQTVW